MRIIGIVPGAKLFGSEDLYADQYLFVNGYPKRILANGATPIGILSSDGYAAQDSLALCDAFVFCGGARFYPYHFQIMEYAAKSGKPVLGICLGMQMMNTYFLVAEEAVRRGWDRPLLDTRQPSGTPDGKADDHGRVDAQLPHHAPGAVAVRCGPNGRRYDRSAGIW